MVSDSEPEEVEESMAEGAASGLEDVEPEAEEEEADGTQPVFKTPKARPRYKTTPFRKNPASADRRGESPQGSGQKIPKTPGSGTATTPSPLDLGTPTSDQTPTSSGQRCKLRSREPGSGN